MPRILCLDDHEAGLLIRSALLAQLGFEPVLAKTPTECLKILKDPQRTIDLLITDFRMDEMDGVALARKAKKLRSKLPIILLTGYADLRIPQGLFVTTLVKGGPISDLKVAIAVALPNSIPLPSRTQSAFDRSLAALNRAQEVMEKSQQTLTEARKFLAGKKEKET